MVRRETLETVGYFDEDLFAYFEDNDWQQRILQSGEIILLWANPHYHKVSQPWALALPKQIIF